MGRRRRFLLSAYLPHVADFFGGHGAVEDTELVDPALEVAVGGVGVGAEEDMGPGDPGLSTEWTAGGDGGFEGAVEIDAQAFAVIGGDDEVPLLVIDGAFGDNEVALVEAMAEEADAVGILVAFEAPGVIAVGDDGLTFGSEAGDLEPDEEAEWWFLEAEAVVVAKIDEAEILEE